MRRAAAPRRDPAGPQEKNYITPDGFRRLEEEFRHLKYKERPEVTQTVSWAAENGDRSENGDYIYGKKRLREIDRRMHFLAKQMENAEVVDPATCAHPDIRFGATVTIVDEEERTKTYAIVGTDEVDAACGRISWRSPLARALMHRREGDIVTVATPRGEQEVEILKVEYRIL